MSQTDNTTAGDETQAKPEPRERSGIPFPYDDLETAVEIVRKTHELFGGTTDLNGLSAAMNQTSQSGAFRSKVGAARHFGLIGSRRGSIDLTPLGYRVLDEAERPEALADAFLKVELFAKLVEQFKACPLPPASGIEAQMREHGVPTKSLRAARLVFLRSAKQAGFFDVNGDRLVRPQPGAQRVDAPAQMRETDPREQREGGVIGNKPAIITELFRRLPDDGQAFDKDDRELWMRAFTANLDLVYRTAKEAREDGQASIPQEA